MKLFSFSEEEKSGEYYARKNKGQIVQRSRYIRFAHIIRQTALIQQASKLVVD